MPHVEHDEGKRRAANASWRSVAKVIAVGLLLLLAPFAWIPLTASKALTLFSGDYPLLATIYLMTALLGVVAIIGAPFLRSGLARWPLVLLFLSGFAANHIAQAVLGQPLSTHMVGTLLQTKKFYGNAAVAYEVQILVGLGIAACLAVPLLMRPRHELSLGTWFLAVPVGAGLLTTLVMANLIGRVEEFPSPIAVPIQIYLGAKEIMVYSGARDPVVYEHPVQRAFEKILLVVDEGVRGDYVQINNPAFDNTPFLASMLPTLANFGLATSYSNCSDTSRMSLRSGARPTDFPDPEQHVLHQPTFWQYAKKAGYRTVHMDAWQSIHPMDNMQTYDELRYIDQIASVSLTPYSQADDRLAELMLAEFEKPGPSLLYVEKMGMHTPYRSNLPDGPSYQPKAGSIPHPEFTGARAADVRDYVVGIWWRTDRFFQRVLPVINKPGVLLIYTSDHGQSMYDGGYDATACSGTNAVKGEGLVPLFVFAGDPPVRAEFRAAAARSFDRAAHTDIFPTLLSAMGFNPELVEPPYGGGLLNIPSNRRRRFFVFSPFTPAMNWVAVE